MSINASMLTSVKSGLLFCCALVAVGRFTSMPFMLIIVKLTSMKEASRKNMMSINGMISIRAFLIGTGVLLGLWPCIFGLGISLKVQAVEHQNDVVRGGLELELKFGQFRIKEVKEN